MFFGLDKILLVGNTERQAGKKDFNLKSRCQTQSKACAISRKILMQTFMLSNANEI